MTDRGVPIGGTGFKAYTLEYSIDVGSGPEPVQVEPIVIADGTDPTKRAVVTNATPAANAQGIVVRQAGLPQLFTKPYDEFVLGYTSSVLTSVVSKLATVVQQTATLSYDGSGNLIGVVMS